MHMGTGACGHQNMHGNIPLELETETLWKSDMGAENLTQFLCRQYLTAEPSLAPSYFILQKFEEFQLFKSEKEEILTGKYVSCNCQNHGWGIIAIKI